MAQILNLTPSVSISSLSSSFFNSSHSSRSPSNPSTLSPPSWSSLQHKLKCNGRFLCLFSDGKKELFGSLDQARKALEGALSGKKNELEKWNKEIKKREELGGGGDTGGGGWFGWGGRFGWSNDDNFWQEAKQAIITVLGIVLMYLLVAKGELLLAVILNPLLYTLRGTRNGFSFISSKILKISNDGGILKKEDYQPPSAKENVLRKWGSE